MLCTIYIHIYIHTYIRRPFQRRACWISYSSHEGAPQGNRQGNIITLYRALFITLFNNYAFVYILNIQYYIIFIGSASAADVFFAYSFVSNMGFGLIWYAALDSWRDLAADCISQKSTCLILRFQCFRHFVHRLSIG